MEQIDRRRFLSKAGRWAAALGAVFLIGTLPSCSSGESGKSTSLEGSPADDNSASYEPVAVITSACIGCGKCTRGICPVDAIHLEDKQAVISERCIGCGRCIAACPEGAIELSEKTVSSNGHDRALKLMYSA